MGVKLNPFTGKLDVVDSPSGDFNELELNAGTASEPSIAFAGDTNTGIYSPGADQVAISTNGTGRLFVTSDGTIKTSGNISLAGASAGGSRYLALLDETASYTGSYVLQAGGGSAGYGGAITMYGHSHASYPGSIYLGTSSGSSGSLIFGTGHALDPSAERMRLDSSGRLGLGTSSPTATLHVVGSSILAGNVSVGTTASAAYLQFPAVTGWGPRIQQGGASINDFAVFTNNTEHLTVKSDGKVGIGTASPGALLHLNATNPVLRWSGSTSGNCEIQTDGGSLLINADSGNTASSSNIAFRVDNSEKARIDSSGRLLVGTSSSTNNVNGNTKIATVIVGNGASGGFDLTGYVGSGSSAYTPSINLQRSIGTTDGTMTAVGAAPHYLGQINFRGSNGTAFATGASIHAIADNNSVAWSSGDNPGALVFSTTADSSSSPTERLRIDSQGRVGIGTTSPSTPLEVESSEDILIRAESTDRFAHIDLVDNAATTRFTTDGATGTLRLRADIGDAATGSTIQFEIDGSEHARITSDGKLLVGTSSARSNLYGAAAFSALFQAEGAANDSGQRSIAFTYNNSNGASPIIALSKTRGTTVGSNTIVQSGDELGIISFQGADGNNLVTGARIIAEVDGTPGANDMPGRLVFSTTAEGGGLTERMRISSAGLVTVGGGSVSTEEVLRVNNGSASAGLKVFSTVGSVGQALIRGDGDLENTNNSYGAISDIKLKENIVDANSQWDDLKALQVRNYNFKTETGFSTHTQLGLVAQEVELVSPGLVSESPDRDAEGNDLGTVTKSVNYSVLYMKAVKALQEAMERIEQLETEMAAVKAQLS